MKNTKKCFICKAKKSLKDFYYSKIPMDTSKQSTCKKCKSKIQWQRRKKDPDYCAWMKKYELIRANRQKQKRRQGLDTSRFILSDSKCADRKNGFLNNLTREFIEEKIKIGCFYCGELKLRMTLDRIDNSKGHTKANVIPACIRCNYTRRDMPFKAWCYIANGIKKARTKGLFGRWTGRTTYHKKANRHGGEADSRSPHTLGKREPVKTGMREQHPPPPPLEGCLPEDVLFKQNSGSHPPPSAINDRNLVPNV
jgi:hypothetical protein